MLLYCYHRTKSPLRKKKGPVLLESACLSIDTRTSHNKDNEHDNNDSGKQQLSHLTIPASASASATKTKEFTNATSSRDHHTTRQHSRSHSDPLPITAAATAAAATTANAKQANNNGIDGISSSVCYCRRRRHRNNRHVRFYSVEFQEYAITFGEHPCAGSFPLTLDWKHTPNQCCSLDDYEYQYHHQHHHHQYRGNNNNNKYDMHDTINKNYKYSKESMHLDVRERWERLRLFSDLSEEQLMHMEQRRRAILENEILSIQKTQRNNKIMVIVKQQHADSAS